MSSPEFTAKPGEPPVLSTEIWWPACVRFVVAAGVLGVLDSGGDWLFNPLGGWSVALIPTLCGIIVALIMALPTRPNKLAGLPHIIDRVGVTFMAQLRLESTSRPEPAFLRDSSSLQRYFMGRYR